MAEQPGKYERLRNTINHLREIGPTPFELAVVRALHDIHRRVIEEPWFGRTIHDVAHHINQRLGQEHEKGQEPQHDYDPAEFYSNTRAQGSAHDYSPEKFYGREEGAGQQRAERGSDRTAAAHGTEPSRTQQEQHDRQQEREERDRGYDYDRER